jgi:hypothetical protein
MLFGVAFVGLMLMVRVFIRFWPLFTDLVARTCGSALIAHAYLRCAWSKMDTVFRR